MASKEITEDNTLVNNYPLLSEIPSPSPSVSQSFISSEDTSASAHRRGASVSPPVLEHNVSQAPTHRDILDVGMEGTSGLWTSTSSASASFRTSSSDYTRGRPSAADMKIEKMVDITQDCEDRLKAQMKLIQKALAQGKKNTAALCAVEDHIGTLDQKVDSLRSALQTSADVRSVKLQEFENRLKAKVEATCLAQEYHSRNKDVQVSHIDTALTQLKKDQTDLRLSYEALFKSTTDEFACLHNQINEISTSFKEETTDLHSELDSLSGQVAELRNVVQEYSICKGYRVSLGEELRRQRVSDLDGLLYAGTALSQDTLWDLSDISSINVSSQRTSLTDESWISAICEGPLPHVLAVATSSLHPNTDVEQERASSLGDDSKATFSSGESSPLSGEYERSLSDDSASIVIDRTKSRMLNEDCPSPKSDHPDKYEADSLELPKTYHMSPPLSLNHDGKKRAHELSFWIAYMKVWGTRPQGSWIHGIWLQVLLGIITCILACIVLSHYEPFVHPGQAFRHRTWSNYYSTYQGQGFFKPRF